LGAGICIMQQQQTYTSTQFFAHWEWRKDFKVLIERWDRSSIMISRLKAHECLIVWVDLTEFRQGSSGDKLSC